MHTIVLQNGFRMESIEPLVCLPQVRENSARAKRLLDAVVSSLFIVMGFPFVCVIAVLIKLDSPGTVFFSQYRYGENGRLFKIYKFRSMYANSCSITGGAQAQKNDPRVTRMGKILRATSIDELPQLLNVLRGEMSLVGPRPHAVDHDRHYSQHIPYYTQRFAMKPGLTGLAQISGFRGETPFLEQMRNRVLYDLEYIHRQSFWLDVVILAATFKVLVHSKAY